MMILMSMNNINYSININNSQAYKSDKLIYYIYYKLDLFSFIP